MFAMGLYKAVSRRLQIGDKSGIAMQDYLRSTNIIDWDNPDVRSLAVSLAGDAKPMEIARRCFDWVRDEVSHSFDINANSVTCMASEVLRKRTGICYAKTHLLAAVLRANSIPTGFGYQQLALDDSGSAFCLHGFNFVFLNDFGWYAVDPRGNREGVSTKFDPPHVHLAFPLRQLGEKTYDTVFPDPLPAVVNVLRENQTVVALRRGLPDCEISPRDGDCKADQNIRMI